MGQRAAGLQRVQREIGPRVATRKLLHGEFWGLGQGVSEPPALHPLSIESTSKLAVEGCLVAKKSCREPPDSGWLSLMQWLKPNEGMICSAYSYR